MDFTPNADQIGLIDAVGKLVAPYRLLPPNTQQTLLTSGDLDKALCEGGFRDVARFEGMGALDAVLLAEIVHSLPYTTEFAGSALVAPALGFENAGPLALLEAPGTAPARFLVPGATALIADGEDVRLLALTEAMIEPVETPFAYPLGRLVAPVGEAPVIAGAAPVMRHYWGLALAAEIGATARAALDLTTDYVKDRRQFGKPIGSYQAIQHRLSECASIIHAIQALVRRAAALGTPEAAAIALIHAKDACPRIIYDTHQFQGAIGLTYEYPLHFYTYRLRLLHGELGSVADNAERLAVARWDAADVDWND